MHRLDQIMPNIPAKLFDHEALTLRAEVQTALAGIFINIGSSLSAIGQFPSAVIRPTPVVACMGKSAARTRDSCGTIRFMPDSFPKDLNLWKKRLGRVPGWVWEHTKLETLVVIRCCGTMEDTRDAFLAVGTKPT